MYLTPSVSHQDLFYKVFKPLNPIYWVIFIQAFEDLRHLPRITHS